MISTELKNAKEEIKEHKEALQEFMEGLAELLSPCVSDEINIRLRIKELLTVEEQLRIAKKEKELLKESFEREKAGLLKKITQLEEEVLSQQKENKTMLTRLRVLEVETKQITKQQTFLQRMEKWLPKVGKKASL